MKHLLTTALSASVLLAATAAHAGPAETLPQGFFFLPTLGVDYQYTQTDYQGNFKASPASKDSVLEDSIHGGNLHAGARIHKYVGYEIGYSLSDDAEKSVGASKSTANVRGWNADLMGYIPVGGNTELIATAGVSRLRGEFIVPGAGKIVDHENKARVGGGAQYWLTDKVNVRGIVRWQDADFKGATDGAIVSNVGVNYQF